MSTLKSGKWKYLLVILHCPLKGFLLVQLQLSLLSQIVPQQLQTQVCCFVGIRVTMNRSLDIDKHCNVAELTLCRACQHQYQQDYCNSAHSKPRSKTFNVCY